MMEANSNLTRDAATILAERGTSPVDNGKCTTAKLAQKDGPRRSVFSPFGLY